MVLPKCLTMPSGLYTFAHYKIKNGFAKMFNYAEWTLYVCTLQVHICMHKICTIQYFTDIWDKSCITHTRDNF